MSELWGGESGGFNSPYNSSQLVASYVHSGNKVIQPTSLDLVTGIWTTDQSLNTLLGANGTSYSCISRCTTYTNNIIPRELKEGDGHKIQVISDNTFYIQANNVAITSYPHANNSTVDVSKISFENPISISVTIDISQLGLTEFLFRGSGCRGREGWSYINLDGVHDGGSSSSVHIILDGRNFSTQSQEQYTRYDAVTGVYLHQGIRSASKVWANASGTWAVTGQNEFGNRVIESYSNFRYTGLRMNFNAANGYTIEIYNLRG